ncbi:hypothetical protein HPB52_015486 [Rhipicephalus sanguineus]|uniref:Uncharacterized protein n=1 Tax=Rhipicephalus sanguineus TaxID=34632 RepID=A0A9D4PWR2_RHISA|nr:hypothetical protein HPB52_015486 [Rhipicephalus sanguineus]
MPRRGRKCHSAHKFGSKGGKNAPHTPAAVAANGTVTTALPDSDVEAPTESRQHRNGLDTHDSSGDTDRAQQRADEKVAGSSSSSDSPRSGEGNVRDSHPPESEPDYMIVDLDCINALIARRTRQSLEVRQREAGRAALGVHRGVPNEAVQGEVGWSSFEAREAVSKLAYERRLSQLPDGRWAREVFKYIHLKCINTKWVLRTKRLAERYEVAPCRLTEKPQRDRRTKGYVNLFLEATEANGGWGQ